MLMLDDPEGFLTELRNVPIHYRFSAGGQAEGMSTPPDSDPVPV
jgi:hypothetical protein